MNPEDREWLLGILSVQVFDRLTQIENRLHDVELRVTDAHRAVERVETALLTAFHSWASPADQKLRSHREAIRALDLQIEEIAGRVEKLEARRDLPN